jgi:hypothetical protein
VLVLAAAAIAVACIGPVGFLAVSLVRGAGLVALASVAGLYKLLSRTNRISPMYVALFPVAAALVVGAMLRSMAAALWRGGVNWRGTFYSLTELREHARRQISGSR